MEEIKEILPESSVIVLESKPDNSNDLNTGIDFDNIKVIDKKAEVETKWKREDFPQFRGFILACGIFAVIYTFCRYKNGMGIFASLDYFATIAFVTFSFKLFGYKLKPGYIFTALSYLLIGTNICMTVDPTIIAFDRIGGILILFVGMLHECFNDKDWGFGKYFTALNNFFWTSIVHVADPILDMIQDEKKGKVNPNVKYIIIGIVIAIPLASIVLVLLASADLMFGKVFKDFFEKISVGDIILVILMFIAVFISAYALLRNLSFHNIKEEVGQRKTANPVIGITFNSVLTFIYLVFSVFQFVFLFFGAGLPEGYTYAEYAHEGFYQLVAVSILNLLIVFISKVIFDKNKVLNVILAVTSLCTFVMIASSTYRMMLYIGVYRLTVLRVLTLWALAVISLIMAVILVYIFKPEIPAVKIMVMIVTVMYIGLAYSHPTSIIAKYNMKEFMRTGNGDLWYVAELSEATDAFFLGDEIITNPSYSEKMVGNFSSARSHLYKCIREEEYGEYENSFRKFNFEISNIQRFMSSYEKNVLNYNK